MRDGSYPPAELKRMGEQMVSASGPLLFMGMALQGRLGEFLVSLVPDDCEAKPTEGGKS
jgi:hypothetical protein